MPMTHDPLCPYRPDKWTGWMSVDRGLPCRCNLIVKVRTDERRQAADRMKTFLLRNFPISPAANAMEAGMHAIKNTPVDELPQWLRPEDE